MLSACEKLVTEARASVREISWEEVDERGEGSGVLVDVREPHEFAEQPVPGAINIPRGLLEFAIDKHPRFAGVGEDHLLATPLYLFCGTGGRSALAAIALGKLGFKEVYSVRGGVNLRD
jgi:rhodanese-related sulfurtransferase